MNFACCNTDFGPVTAVFEANEIVGLAFGESSTAKELFPKHLLSEDLSLSVKIHDLFQGKDVPFKLIGTPFQVRVWTLLMQIPRGQTATYQDIAKKIGDIKFTRAAATAIAKNPLSFIVPCHRVLPKGQKGVGQYRWGPHIKSALLRWEGAII